MDSRWSDNLLLGYCPSLDDCSQLAIDRSPLGKVGRGTADSYNRLHFGRKGLKLAGAGKVAFPHVDQYSTPVVSVSCWAISASESGAGVVTKDNSGASPRSWFLDLGSGWRWVVINSGHEVQVASAGFTANVWAHLVCTFDGSNARIYKNGKLAEANPLTGLMWNNARPITVGGFDTGGATFNGCVDDVQVRGRVLTANEAAELYRLGPGGIYRTRRKVFYAPASAPESSASRKILLLMQ